MKTESAAAWFARFPILAKEPVFTLRVLLRRNPRTSLIVRVFEGPVQRPYGHKRLYCEGRVNGDVLFPRESFHVGIPSGESIDGNFAKECVLSLFAIKPGDTDDEFFEDYSPEQLSFVEIYGEELNIIKEERYGTF